MNTAALSIAALPGMLANPALVGGFVAASIPIIIYLLNRQKFKRIEWAAMEYLLRALRKNKRRILLQNIILLIIRTLIIIALVAALAKPVGEHLLAGLTAERKNVVILMDDSFSMGYKVGTKTRLDRALDAAKKIADRLSSGDKFKLIVFSSDIVLNPKSGFYNIADEKDKLKVLAEIDSIRITHKPTNLAKALAALGPVLDELEGDAKGTPSAAAIPKQVYLITDATMNSFMDLSVVGRPGGPESADIAAASVKNPEITAVCKQLKERGAVVNLIDVGDDQWQNLAVTKFVLGGEALGTGMPVNFIADVRNFRPETAAYLTLTFSIDGEDRKSVEIDVDSFSTREEVFSWTFDREGPHWARVTLKSDHLAVDNSRSLAFQIADSLNVLLVGGSTGTGPWEGETDYLAVGLYPVQDDQRGERLSIFNPEKIAAGAFIDEKLDKYDVVCLANIEDISEEKAAQIENFAASGRGVVIFLGDLVDTAAYNKLLYKDGAGILPAKLVKPVGDPERKTSFNFKIAAPNHPLFATASDRLKRQFETARVYQFMGLEPDSYSNSSAVTVLAAFTDPDASPAILEKRCGRGSVILVTTSADHDWQVWIANPSYLPMVHRIFSNLAASSLVRATLNVGERFQTRRSEWAEDIRIFIPDETNSSIKKTLSGSSESREGYLLSYDETDLSGVYKIVMRSAPREDEAAKGPVEKTDYFAVNVDTAESDLRRATQDDFRQFLSDLPLKFATYGDAVKFGADEAGTDTEFWWKFLLLAVLGLLVLETALAQIFGKYEK
jgi:hypothetical protein